MKKTLISLLGIAALTATPSMAERLVILHTNDTHSNIESDVNGVGGVLQRKAVIDSVRAAEKNVILIDAGDMVQGTLYFKFWRGEVEYPLFNMMDYDIRILGNHEFDNGLDELARHYAGIKKADRLSANYDFSGTPLAGMFKPYVIKKVNGKKIGFIGLNVDPASLIADYNTGAMRFSDVIETANRLAAELKHK
ncbi:MAG: metallophosphoesterase, partial [Muribaculaceae bacterium]|nr:metallophosphoesterase [Muribaculaceae bacterium]